MHAQIASMRATVTRVMKAGTPAFGATAARLRDAIDSLDRATSLLLWAVSSNAPAEALAGATPYLRLFGLPQGGAALAEMALAASARIAAGAPIPPMPATSPSAALSGAHGCVAPRFLRRHPVMDEVARTDGREAGQAAERIAHDTH